jgi:hypothetical protein
MEEPLLAVAPVTLLGAMVQLNVVPLTPFGFVMVIPVVRPEQKDWLVGEAKTVGIGLTVTACTKGVVLAHPFGAVAVIVYVTAP